MTPEKHEKRRTQRRISKFKSLYPVVLFEDPSEIANVNAKQAEVLDISETGMGIHTSFPLKVGNTIRFTKNRNWKLPKAAVVVWSMKENDGYRTGISFTADHAAH
ncbi:MAG: PilZ domain-containing protein [Thermodesulfobacteriota bacterium]|jgi:hypothetical protein